MERGAPQEHPHLRALPRLLLRPRSRRGTVRLRCLRARRGRHLLHRIQLARASAAGAAPAHRFIRAPHNPSPLPRLPRPPEGILDALPERRRSPPQSSPLTPSSPASPAAAAPRMIPRHPPPGAGPGAACCAVSARQCPCGAAAEAAKSDGGWKDFTFSPFALEEDDEEMLPPHEMVARARARESPMTTFSVLEGAGRTLQGTDLRQVRNAVLRKTGFLD
ncbi:hypothetical protein HU200_007077 [Digitaria exilis]|uniref:Senescence regulator n=1 Tax=Digitaria exilis TaxID=1010633 RepID=A0A835KSV1_9POAL|nr:hypothetical protein HU200_007077 [Digitaria exilis]